MKFNEGDALGPKHAHHERATPVTMPELEDKQKRSPELASPGLRELGLDGYAARVPEHASAGNHKLKGRSIASGA